MWGSAVLDTVIGLSFVFFAVAMLSAAVVEWWATVQRKRPKFLLRGLQAMLVDDRGARTRWWSLPDAWAALRAERQLYRTVLNPTVGGAAGDPLVRLMLHPLLRAHRQSDPDGRYTRLPAYLPAADVAAALVDVLLGDPDPEDRDPGARAAGDVAARIAALESRSLARSLHALWERADGDHGAFLAAIAEWYECQMQRVSGWYKRWSKRWIGVVGALVALAFGIDAVRVADALYTDPGVRATATAAALAADPATCGGDAVACAREVLADLDGTGLPIGWPAGCPASLSACVAEPGSEPDAGDWLAVLVGLALTTAAASIGAPFWFDAIGRLAPLRNTGARPRTGP